LIALFGPTASGKTAVAGILRERLGAEVISADSAALYAGLPIITAAPDYPAQLVGVVPLAEDVSVAEYQRLAHAAIDGAERPLLVGGTGLYFRAALSAMEIPPRGRREHWQAEVERLGPEAAHAQLAEVDPLAAERVHANDRKRLVLDVPLDALDERIETRTRAMADAGAADEAKRAWAGPLSETARKVLGLEQFATLPEDEAVEAVAQATRRLARYQRKWLRRMPGVVTLDGNRAAAEVADEIVALGRARERLSGH